MANGTGERAGSARYTAAQGRRFALTLAVAFGAIAAITIWRERETIGLVAGSLALTLLIAGLAIPSRLSPLERAWMSLAHTISRITTPIFMGVVYFVVLTPAGMIRRTFGQNPLTHSGETGSYWAPRIIRDAEAKRRRMERQF